MSKHIDKIDPRSRTHKIAEFIFLLLKEKDKTFARLTSQAQKNLHYFFHVFFLHSGRGFDSIVQLVNVTTRIFPLYLRDSDQKGSHMTNLKKSKVD